MSIQSTLPARSLGLKLIAICALVILMSIPAMFISYISYERSTRADEVTREVSERYGGEQYISGPMIVAPYIQKDPKGQITESGNYVVFAESGTANFTGLETKIRQRSLFKVPTYSGSGQISARFAADITELDTGGTIVDWDKAEIIVSLSDVRGLQKDVVLTLPDGKIRQFEPARIDAAQNFSNHEVPAVVDSAGAVVRPYIAAKAYRHNGWLNDHRGQTYLSVPIRDVLAKGDEFAVDVDISISGARRLGVTPFAQSTSVKMRADWADPGFEGGFPPGDRDITDAGFSADWSVPYLRRGIRAHGKAHQLPALTMDNKVMTVQFVSQNNPYQTVNRALKYAVLFIGMVFLAYFLFEVIVGVPVHVAQYLLIGLAQSIFYLLLLAFSEHVGFTIAFLIAAGATISATAGYAGAVFGDRKYILRAGIVFGLVYGLLYTLMRMQDFALMIGALASFLAIAMTMYLTRNINWYAVTDKKAELIA